MEFTDVMTAISTLGFPIFCSCVLLYLLWAEQKNHKEEMSELKEAINGNTIVMTELKQLLEDMKK